MGKIRVKTLGIEEAEEKQKKEAKKRKESKSADKRLTKVPGLKGGQRVVAVGPSEEELAKIDSVVIATRQLTGKQSQKGEDDKVKKAKVSKVSKGEEKRRKVRSKSYQLVAKMIDKTKKYKLSEALELLSKTKRLSFDETVELHINTTQPKISIVTTLPHGTGKKTRVAIADEKIIENVAKGKIDFDVLLASPIIMPKLAKVAKFLGPRGLMPNPKNGTITTNPETLVKKYEGGQITLKTEGKMPIMHASVGKLSFGEKKLAENIQTLLAAVEPQNIKNVTLKSTMSPGIKVKLD